MHILYTIVYKLTQTNKLLNCFYAFILHVSSFTSYLHVCSDFFINKLIIANK